MTCPKCQQEMTRNNLGSVRGWFCWECDEFVEDEDGEVSFDSFDKWCRDNAKALEGLTFEQQIDEYAFCCLTINHG